MQTPEGINEGCPGEPSGRGTGRGDAIPSIQDTHAAINWKQRAHVLEGADFLAALKAARAMDEAGRADDDHGINCTIDDDDDDTHRVNGRRNHPEDPLHQDAVNADMLRRSLLDEEERSETRTKTEEQRQWIRQMVQEELMQEIQCWKEDIMHLNLQLEEAKAEILELYKLVDMLVRREAERVPEPEVAGGSQMRTPTTSRRMDHQKAASSSSWKQQEFILDDIKVEISPMRSVVGGYFGGDNLQLPLVTTSSSSSPESVRIAAFGTGVQGHHSSPSRPQMMVTGATPALLALQANMKTPFFGGDERKWPQFTRY